MRNCLALKFTLLVLLIHGASSLPLEANASDPQAQIRILEPEQVNPGDHITVYEKSGLVSNLVVEKVATTEQTNQQSDLTGTYISDITDKDNRNFRKENHKKLVVTFEQDGERVVGNVRSLGDSAMRGIREGDKVKFFFNSRTIAWYQIQGEWKVSADANRLEGTWRSFNNPSSGQWNLTRIGPAVATRHTDAPTIIGKLIEDQSTVEIRLADIDRIEIRNTESTEIAASKTAQIGASEQDCEISSEARNAIEDARSAWDKVEYTPGMYDLILQAEAAVKPPDCDSTRAKIMADKAKELASAAAPVKPVAPRPKPKSSRSSNSDFGEYYVRCLGEISFVYGGIAVISGGADLAIFTTASAAVLCVPAVGIVVSTETIMAPSLEASSRKNRAAYRNTEQHRFVALTGESLARDMARGGGEYLTTIAYLEGCPVEVHDSFAQMTRRNFSQIIPQAETKIAAILRNLDAQIANDPLLAAECNENS